MDMLFQHIYASIILSLCVYYVYIVMEEHFFLEGMTLKKHTNWRTSATAGINMLCLSNVKIQDETLISVVVDVA